MNEYTRAWESVIYIADDFCTILPSISCKKEESLHVCFHKMERKTIQNTKGEILLITSPEGHYVLPHNMLRQNMFITVFFLLCQGHTWKGVG